MSDFNFEETLTELGETYEEAKDAANAIFPIVPQDVPVHGKLLDTLQKLRDICAVTAQAFDAFQKATSILKPHPEYDFVHEDKVFIENAGGAMSFFILLYSPETADWVLIPYTDVTFSTPIYDSEGKVMAEPLHAYGYDILERVEDYDIEELK